MNQVKYLGVKQIGKYYKLNLNIKAKQVRLLGVDNKQVGVVLIEKALEEARQLGLDLVEISGNADPPVVRIVDFKKFKYEESKKDRLARKNVHHTGTKEIWLGPLIGKHDLENRLRRAQEFLEEGNRVKLTVKFSGREMNHPEFGHEVLNKSKALLNEIGEADGFPKFMGRNLSLSFNPVKKQK